MEKAAHGVHQCLISESRTGSQGIAADEGRKGESGEVVWGKEREKVE